MSRGFIGALALTIVAGTFMLAQATRSPEVQFKAAQYKEQVEGDLKGAIPEYEKVVAGQDRALGAQALLRIAEITQKLHLGDADAVYDRLIREFPEQTSTIAFARARRTPAPTPPQAQARTPAPVQAPAPIVVTADRLKDVAVFDRKGTVLLRVSESGPINLVSISPDGQRVAYSPDRNRIVVLDVVSRTRTAIVSTGYSPAGWSPDGSRLTYLTGPSGAFSIYTASSFGFGDEDLVLRGPNGLYHWTADGRFVIAGLGGDFVAVPVAAGPKTPLRIMSQVTTNGPRVSPDSRFLAYTSAGVRESEIMVRPLTLNEFGSGVGDSEWKVSSGGALGMARWRSDGGELYYIAPDGYVMAVPTSTTGQDFSAGTPVRLFRTPATFPLTNVVGQRADVSGDGERFVLLLASAN